MLGNTAMSIRTVTATPSKHPVPTVVAWLGSGNAGIGHASWPAGGVMASTTAVMPPMRRAVVRLASP